MSEPIPVCLTCGQRTPVEVCPYAWGCPKGIESEPPPMPREVLDAFGKVAALSSLEVVTSEIQVVALAAPHRRPRALPDGFQAVYSFFLGNRCLKVGKAGQRSGARYCQHHYGVNAPSTLASSILKPKNKERIADLVPWMSKPVRALDERSIGRWIEKNTRRLDFLLPTRYGIVGLALLEVFLQARFRPEFEGPAS